MFQKIIIFQVILEKTLSSIGAVVTDLACLALGSCWLGGLAAWHKNSLNLMAAYLNAARPPRLLHCLLCWLHMHPSTIYPVLTFTISVPSLIPNPAQWTNSRKTS